MCKVGRKPSENSITKLGKRQTFYLKNTLINQLDSFARSKEIPKSEVINIALENYFHGTLRNHQRKTYRVLSLFSGCGGMDLGFKGGFNFLNKYYKPLGFQTVFANDIMASACETFENNFKLKPLLGDIKEYLDNGGELPDCDIVIGGFPCQDFSVAGKRRGLTSERGSLYKQMKRVIEMKQPMIFIAENVKGLANLGNALETIKQDFSRIYPKYKINHFLKLAADFGVPQTRERIFIVGIRDDIDVHYFPPAETHAAEGIDGRKVWVSAREALNDLEQGSDNVPNQDQYSKARRYGDHCQGNKAIKADFPGPTIRAEHHGNIEFHYNNQRRLTVRECARIQSFPDDFVFVSSASKNYVLVGNAVPPVLGWHIANSVKEFLENAFKKKKS